MGEHGICRPDDPRAGSGWTSGDIRFICTSGISWARDRGSARRGENVAASQPGGRDGVHRQQHTAGATEAGCRPGAVGHLGTPAGWRSVRRHRAAIGARAGGEGPCFGGRRGARPAGPGHDSSPRAPARSPPVSHRGRLWACPVAPPLLRGVSGVSCSVLSCSRFHPCWPSSPLQACRREPVGDKKLGF